MSERDTGVVEVDPDVAVRTLSDYLTSTDKIIRNRLQFATALGESPSDLREAAHRELQEARDVTCDTLTWLKKEHGVAVHLFDPETERWYQIIGVGENPDSLRLVAQVHDPEDPHSQVTKWLGPAPMLGHSPLESTAYGPLPFEPGPSRILGELALLDPLMVLQRKQ